MANFKNGQNSTPVLFLVFNRPDTTRQVFQKIREARPPRLYVAADGPRNKNEEAKCEEVRNIATNVDWECEVKTLFQEDNLGCGPGPVTGITWFFENEEYGIILEDDCYPSESFFPFCEILLEKYVDDTRIMHINGNNYGADESNFFDSDFTYHFNRIPQAWGWASWRRAWQYFDWEVENFKSVQELEYWNSFFKNKKYKEEQFNRWRLVEGGKRDIWDFQWQFSVISNFGSCIVPKKNLISNIGWGENATHSRREFSTKSNIPTFELDFPLRHPETFLPDKNIDTWYQERMLGKESLLKRIKNKLSKFKNS